MDARAGDAAAALLGVAAVAGILAGAVAVYVRQSGDWQRRQRRCQRRLRRRGRRGRPAGAAGQGRGGGLPHGRPARISCATSPSRRPTASRTSLAAFAGKTVLVNLWATWCVPCRAEMPALDRLEGALGSDGFSVVAVNIDMTQSGACPGLSRRDRRQASGLLRRSLLRHLQGPEEARAGARPADDASWSTARAAASAASKARPSGIPTTPRHSSRRRWRPAERAGEPRQATCCSITGATRECLAASARCSLPATSTRLRPLDLAR